MKFPNSNDIDAGVQGLHGGAQGEARAPAERLVLQDEPLAPIFTYTMKHLVKPYVHGLEPNILNFYYSKPVRLDPH